MKKMIIFIFLLLINFQLYADRYPVEVFMVKIMPNYRVYSYNYGEDPQEVDFLLVETDDVDDGTYKVNLYDEGNDVYNIMGTDYYVKMDWLEMFVMEEAILKVETYMGHKLFSIIL